MCVTLCVVLDYDSKMSEQPNLDLIFVRTVKNDIYLHLQRIVSIGKRVTVPRAESVYLVIGWWL
jgi:hypothetical protein